MMVFPGVKIKAYQIRRNVYQLYKIRLHAMTSHPGARPIDDVGRDRPGAQQTLVATPTLTMVVPLPHHDADLLLYRSSTAWGWVLETGGSGGSRPAHRRSAGHWPTYCRMQCVIATAKPWTTVR